MNFQQVAATKVQDGPRGFRAHSSSCGPLTSYAEAPHARHPLERPRTPSGWMSEKMGLADFSWCNLYSIQYKAMSGCQLSVAVFYQNLHFTRSRGVSRKIPSGYGRPDATILENPTVHWSPVATLRPALVQEFPRNCWCEMWLNTWDCRFGLAFFTTHIGVLHRPTRDVFLGVKTKMT